MIAIIDVCGNNLTSLINAIQTLGYDYCLTHDETVIRSAQQVILPGVGHAKTAMQELVRHDLNSLIPQLTQPVLGICLGMQLLCEWSEEGDTAGLGIIPGEVKRIPLKLSYPIPHMGWNQLTWQKDSPLKQGLPEKAYVYFVHSYALALQDYTLAATDYDESFTAIIARDNFYGMQFHPEKSAQTGLTLLNNFLQLEL